jgi:hypothetical protein
MKKNAYADTTIKATGKRLKHLKRNCDLNNPEEIKGFIANKQCSNAYKETLTEAYDHYCQANEITWNKPFYRRYDKLPKIPTPHLQSKPTKPSTQTIIHSNHIGLIIPMLLHKYLLPHTLFDDPSV